MEGKGWLIVGEPGPRQQTIMRLHLVDAYESVTCAPAMYTWRKLWQKVQRLKCHLCARVKCYLSARSHSKGDRWREPLMPVVTKYVGVGYKSTPILRNLHHRCRLMAGRMARHVLPLVLRVRARRNR